MAYLGAIGASYDRYYLARKDGAGDARAHSFGSPAYHPTRAPIYGLPTVTLDRIWRSVGTPLWWGSRPIGALPLPNFKLEGRVLQRTADGTEFPLVTRVALYYRRSMGLIAVTRSSPLGDFRFDTLMPEMGQYFMVALDPDGSPDQNALIYDKLAPVPI